MKPLNLLDTERKRRRTLFLLVDLYWLWQGIWLLFLCASLMQIRDYASLFVVQAGLDRLTGSWLNRILAGFVQQGWKALLSATHFQNVAALAMSALLLAENRKCRLWALLFACGLAGAVWVLRSGLQSRSLQEAASLLHMAGMGGLLWFGLLVLAALKGLAAEALQ